MVALLVLAGAAAPSQGAAIAALPPPKQPPTLRLTPDVPGGSVDVPVLAPVPNFAPDARISEPPLTAPAAIPAVVEQSAGGRLEFIYYWPRAHDELPAAVGVVVGALLWLGAGCVASAAWASLTADPTECFSLSGFALSEDDSGGWAAGAAHGAEQEWLVLHASGAFADPFAPATGPAPFIPTADKPGAKRSAA